MVATAWPFIDVDEHGQPFVHGTGTKVLQLARQHVLFRWDAEELQRQYPHLTLPQVHAALGYYHEHRDECDRRLAAADERGDSLLAQLENTELQSRLHGAKDKDAE